MEAHWNSQINQLALVFCEYLALYEVITIRMEVKEFYKQVAWVNGRFYSVIDRDVEYVIGETRRQKPKKGHKGGYYVYSTPELASNAEIALKLGSNWIYQRCILKVECWGEMIQYPRFKLCFEYIKPVENLGFPYRYLENRSLGRGEDVKGEREECEGSVKSEGKMGSRLGKMKKETQTLEEEVMEMEKRARAMGIII